MKDPVEEVYRLRDKLAAKFDYNIHAMFEDMRKREGQSGHPVVSRAKPKPRRRHQTV